MDKKHLITFTLALFSLISIAQEEIKIYPKSPKESNGLENKEAHRREDFIIDISNPRMYAYPALKEKANGTAVLICPGGGYSGVSIINEGKNIAEWFNKLGVTAFVLYYRMPNGHTTIPLTDAQTALKIIHKRAKEWNINTKKIGIMGFSAGGHLASTVGTHFKNKKERPAFMLLGYPVVTMNKEFTHMGSRTNLLGKDPNAELVKLYSNELQVKKNTPPTFIVHAKDDRAVPIANSEKLLEALKSKNIPAELQVYEVGGHGFGMTKKGIPADNWDKTLENWLRTQNLIY